MEKLSSSNIFSSKRNRIDFFNFFFYFFFLFFYFQEKSGCFLISEVKLGVRDRAAHQGIQALPRTEELGKLPLDRIRLRRVCYDVANTNHRGKVSRSPFLILNSWEMANELQLKLRLPGDEKENVELLLTEINDLEPKRSPDASLDCVPVFISAPPPPPTLFFIKIGLVHFFIYFLNLLEN